MKMKWRWHEMKWKEETRIIGRQFSIATENWERWVMSGNLASCGEAEAPSPMEYHTRFFNAWGTWYFSLHGALLWFAIRFSVLLLDDPIILHARGTPLHHLGHTIYMLCGQSALAYIQGFEHYLVTFKALLCCGSILLTPGLAQGSFWKFSHSHTESHSLALTCILLNSSQDFNMYVSCNLWGMLHRLANLYFNSQSSNVMPRLIVLVSFQGGMFVRTFHSPATGMFIYISYVFMSNRSVNLYIVNQYCNNPWICLWKMF